MRPRDALFALMLAASLAALVYGSLGRQRGARAATVPMEAASADLSARMGIGNLELTPEGAGSAAASPMARMLLGVAVRQYRDALRAHPEEASGRPRQLLVRRIGILLSVAEGQAPAWRWFQAHPDPPYQALWRAAYAPGVLSAAELRGAVARLEPLRSSWYSDLVRWQLLRKAGEDQRAGRVLLDLRNRFHSVAGNVLLFGELAFLGGLAGLAVWLVLLVNGRALARGDRPLPFAGLPRRDLAEAFVLWFFLMSAGGWAVRQVLLATGVRLPLTAGLLVHLGLQLASGLAGLALLRAAARRPRPAESVAPAGGPLARQEDGLDRGAAEQPFWPAGQEEEGRQQGDGPERPWLPAGQGEEATREGGAPGQPFRPAGQGREAPSVRLLRGVGWGLATYLAAIPLLVVGAVVLQRLLPKVPTPPNPAVTLALAARGPLDWMLLVLMAVVVGPILEEVFFRGVLYPALRRRAGVAVAVLGSATAFALVHPQLPLGFFPILALGAVFAGALELRRSLLACIVAHMLNNAVAMLVMSLMRTP